MLDPTEMRHPSSMLDDYGFEIYEENEFPLAYLLTFRTFGTWLHGDIRWSVGRRPRSAKEGRFVAPNVPLKEAMQAEMHQPQVLLKRAERKAVETAIEQACERRGYLLRAANARTNHAHAVVTARVKPEKIVNTFKAYATRKLRADGFYPLDSTIWARGRSRRYLWKPRFVIAAVDYVLYSQGWIPFEEWLKQSPP